MVRNFWVGVIPCSAAIGVIPMQSILDTPWWLILHGGIYSRVRILDRGGNLRVYYSSSSSLKRWSLYFIATNDLSPGVVKQ